MLDAIDVKKRRLIVGIYRKMFAPTYTVMILGGLGGGLPPREEEVVSFLYSFYVSSCFHFYVQICVYIHCVHFLSILVSTVVSNLYSIFCPNLRQQLLRNIMSNFMSNNVSELVSVVS